MCCKQPVVPFSAVDGLWLGVFLRLRLYAVIDDFMEAKLGRIPGAYGEGSYICPQMFV